MSQCLLDHVCGAQALGKFERPTGKRPWRHTLIVCPKVPPQPRNPRPRTCSARCVPNVGGAAMCCSPTPCRQVNNAYEVLCDPQSRSTYDQYGVWPPPAPAPQGSYANGPHEPFSNPFFRGSFANDHPFRGPRMDPFGGFGFGSRPGPGGFTDPFILFNSIFGDLHRAFASDPFFDDHRAFGSNQFGSGLFGGAFPPLMPSPMNFGGGGMGGSMMQSFSNGGNGGWVSQSWTSSTVNGVTHTKSVRRDSQVRIQAIRFFFSSAVILTTNVGQRTRYLSVPRWNRTSHDKRYRAVHLTTSKSLATAERPSCTTCL